MSAPARVEGTGQDAAVLARFRTDLHSCLTARGDALFEVAEAILCAEGPVTSLVGLSLVPEHRRGHGALYDALNGGRLDEEALRARLAALPIPRLGGRITVAVDVSAWLRPDAGTSPGRCFCHVHGHGRGGDQRVPGWPYQFLVALESGPSSWTAVLDVVRLAAHDDATAVTAAQLRALHARLAAAGHWAPGDPDVVVVMDCGYDVTRLAWLLADLPLLLVARIRSDRVMLAAAPPRAAGAVGRPPRHGSVMALNDAGTWPVPSTQTVTANERYGQVEVTSFDRLHPRLTSRAAWSGHHGPLPIIEGTVIRVAVDHLPGRAPAAAKPMWMWTCAPVSDPDLVTTAWAGYLRRFDIEHTFRFFKQTLGWTTPQVRDPAAADRWTWLVVAAHTQLRLARPLAGDLRRPWERPAPAHRLTPARVRRGFRYLRARTTTLARTPKPTRPGPGRPPGVKNRTRAPLHDVGKKINSACTRDTDRAATG